MHSFVNGALTRAICTLRLFPGEVIHTRAVRPLHRPVSPRQFLLVSVKPATLASGFYGAVLVSVKPETLKIWIFSLKFVFRVLKFEGGSGSS
jgi:hypothetical protein